MDKRLARSNGKCTTYNAHWIFDRGEIFIQITIYCTLYLPITCTVKPPLIHFGYPVGLRHLLYDEMSRDLCAHKMADSDAQNRKRRILVALRVRLTSIASFVFMVR